jgi:hypothetical protein
MEKFCIVSRERNNLHKMEVIKEIERDVNALKNDDEACLSIIKNELRQEL